MKKLKENIRKILIESGYPNNLKIEYTEKGTILTYKKDGEVVTEVVKNIIDKIAELPELPEQREM